MFKKALFCLAIAATTLAASAVAQADTYVRGYYRSSGTYVRSHYRSTRDGNFYNNWSTKPNVNPYTGRVGTRTYPSYRSSTYPSYGRSSYPSYRSSTYPSYRSSTYPSSRRSYGFGSSFYSR